MNRIRAFGFFALLGILGAAAAFLPPFIPGHAGNRSVISIPVTGVIDLGLAAFVSRSIRHAQSINAAAIILDIDTTGGRIDAAETIITSVADCAPLPVFAYIRNNAWSAGALIALSCDVIIMSTGSTVGSAEPRTFGVSSQQETVDEKIISALRAKFRATAEKNHYEPLMAEAMVDKDIELIALETETGIHFYTGSQWETLTEEQQAAGQKHTLSDRGKLLNLTAAEAMRWRVAAAVVESMAAAQDFVRQHINPESVLADNLPVLVMEPTWAENLVRFLTHPLVSSFLLSLGFLGILFELRMPGWGISGTVGLCLLALFFWGHMLVGLTTWMDIALFSVGTVLLLIELLFIPDFGITGIVGILLMIAGVVLGLLKHPLQAPAIQWHNALVILTQASFISLAGLIFFIKVLPATAVWKRISLQTTERADQGFTSAATPLLTVGAAGVAETMLRPSGRAAFDGKRYPVRTAGEFIPAGTVLTVVAVTADAIIVAAQQQEHP